MLKTTLILLGSLASANQEALLRINALEKSFRETQSPVVQSLRLKESAERDLQVLRRLWLTPKRYEILSEHYRNLENKKDPKLPEIYFRLGRHAYIQKKLEDSTLWAESAISNSPPNNPWNSRGQYLLGVIATQKKDFDQAVALFSKLAAKKDETAPAVTAARLALARIAYDQGRFTDAQNIYSEIPKGSNLFEDSLEESAWTDVKSNQLESASTSLDLLFTLYPESKRLPEAGVLLGNVVGTEKGLQKKVETLDHLVTRLGFEQESAEQAREKYKGSEENILTELQPTLPTFRLRSILQPIGRNILRENQVVKTYLGNFEDIYDDIQEMEDGKVALETLLLAVSEPSPTVMDEVAFLEWANSVEHSIMKEPIQPQKLASTEKKKEIIKELESLKKQQEILSDIDSNIGINWLAVGGKREQEAIEIKNRSRAEYEHSLVTRQNIQKLLYKNEVAGLKERKRLALKEEERLRTLRNLDTEKGPLLSRLDDLRREIKIRYEKEIPGLRNEVKAILPQIQSSLEKAKKAKESLVYDARKDLSKILAQLEKEIVDIIKKYRWSVADARYQLHRATEKELAQVRKNAAEETAGLDERFKDIQTDSPLPRLSPMPKKMGFSPEIQTRLADIQYFREQSTGYIQTLESFVKKGIDSKERKYEIQHEKEEARVLDIQAKSREDALFAHVLYLKNDSGSDRAPFALYRMAQLHFERADIESKAAKNEKERDEIRKNNFELAIEPLRKIQKQYPNFTYRDTTLYLLAYALSENGQNQESVSNFERLVNEFPQSNLAPEVHLRIGEHYFSKHQFSAAIAHYQRVLGFGFSFFYDKALYKLAWANYLLGNYDSAIAHFLILLDYSSELSEQDRSRFIEFSDEASEYIAFSMYRGQGVQTAKKIFNQVGWKPYAFTILIRMGKISQDHGDRSKALQAYELAKQEFPLASELPEVTESRIKIFEEQREESQIFDEMLGATKTFNKKSDWWKKNSGDPITLSKADSLMQKVLLSLAGKYEKKKEYSKAEDLYQDLVERFPQSQQAYEASFRLAELSFLQNKYADSITHYDSVTKNGRFQDHFSDALYGIVASREKIIDQKGGVDAFTKNVGKERPVELQNFYSSIDNFSNQSPKDPRIPEALFLAGTIQEKTNDLTTAKKTFDTLSKNYPNSHWKEASMVSLVNASASQQDWKNTVEMSSDILKSNPNLKSETKEKLTALMEGARFKQAEADGNAETFLQFQNDFPKSTLAPKAAYNAFAITKKSGNLGQASQVLDLLLREYPSSPEAAEVRFEQALLADSEFHLDEAIKKYRELLSKDLKKEQRTTVLSNLIQLVLANAKSNSDLQNANELTSHIPASSRSVFEINIAKRATELKKGDFAEKIYSDLITKNETPLPFKVEALASLSLQGWKSGNVDRAASFEKLALQNFSKLKSEEQAQLASKMAYMLELHIAQIQEKISKYHLNIRTDKTFISSFKQKTKMITDAEKVVLQTLSFSSPSSSASALFDLGTIYKGFITELDQLPRPKEGEEEFDKTIASLTAPLKKKQVDTWKKSYGILQEYRLPVPFFVDLVGELQSIGENIPPLPKNNPQWAANVSPLIPELKTELASSPSAQGIQKGILLLGSTGSKDQRRKAISAFSEAQLKNPNSTAAPFNLTILHLLDGSFSEANTTITFLENKLPEADVLSLKALSHWMKNDWEACEPLLMRILSLEPGNHFANVYLTMLKLYQKKEGEALPYAYKAVEKNPKSPSSYLVLSIALRSKNEQGLARLALERAFSISSEDPNILHEIAIQMTRPEEVSTRVELFKSTSAKGSQEAQSDWAKLAFEVSKTNLACDEWKNSVKQNGFVHPSIVMNEKICHAKKEGSQ